MQYFSNLPFLSQALIGGLFAWFITAVGASFVIFFKKINVNVLNIMLSFAAGVMIASSFFSLLTPSIELSAHLYTNSFVVPTLGFLCGILFIILADFVLNKYLKNSNDKANKKRTLMLVGSITLHNIPEGMCVGVAFASVAFGLEGATLIGAIILTFGIAIQNFPEGVAVSLPLRKENVSPKRAFFIGQASGMVEPISSVIACLFVIVIRNILPFLLAFSAGAMIGVVVSELIPEAQGYNKNLSTFGVALGFSLMMILDVALR
ncbi:MAG: ZIP family metal transporter [Clostridia bacterium]|nr:ZIP family metal transporter [Clostridia bacterium]